MPSEPTAVLVNILNGDSPYPLRIDFYFSQTATSYLKSSLMDEMGDLAL